MDHARFDLLARSFRSRRAFGGVVAGTVAALIGSTATGAVRCPKNKKRCGATCIPKRRCCTTAECKPKNSGQVCKRGRCVCPGGMKRCGKRCVLKGAPCPPKPSASCAAGGVTTLMNVSQRFAQVFTEPNGGRLTAVAVRLRNQNATVTGTYNLQLNAVRAGTGMPEETTLALAQRSSASLPDDTLDWVRFDFPSPPQLQPGRQYAIVLSLLGSTAGWVTESRSPDPCPGGTLFLSNNGSPFDFASGFDMPYQTFVKA